MRVLGSFFLENKTEALDSFTEFIFRSHLLDRFETKDGEACVEDLSSCLTQQYSLPIDLHNLTVLVLLHTVTFLVEFSEGVCDLVHEVTQRVEQKVICYPVDDFPEPE